MEQGQEGYHPHMQLRRLQQDLHKVQPLEGSPQDAHWRKAVHLRLERLWLEVRQVGRADPALQEAHRGQAFPVQAVRAGLLKIRPFVTAHEKAHCHVNGELPTIALHA